MNKPNFFSSSGLEMLRSMWLGGTWCFPKRSLITSPLLHYFEENKIKELAAGDKKLEELLTILAEIMVRGEYDERSIMYTWEELKK